MDDQCLATQAGVLFHDLALAAFRVLDRPVAHRQIAFLVAMDAALRAAGAELEAGVGVEAEIGGATQENAATQEAQADGDLRADHVVQARLEAQK